MEFANYWFSGGAAGNDQDRGEIIENSLHNIRSGGVTYHDAAIPAFPGGFTDVSYTLSFWFKTATNVINGTNQCMFSCISGTRNEFWILSAGGIRMYQNNAVNDYSTRLLTDNTGWYHFVVKADNVTPTTGKIWINGQLLPECESGSVNLFNITDAATSYRIMADQTPANYGSGFLAELHFLAGSGAANPTVDDFGYLNSKGVWVPKDYNGNHGTSGFHLDYDLSDPDTMFDDKSSSGNNFTGTGYILEEDPASPQTFYTTPGYSLGSPNNCIPVWDNNRGDNDVYYDGNYRYLDNNSATGLTNTGFDPETANSFYCEFMCYSMSKGSIMGICKQTQKSTQTLPPNIEETYHITSGGAVVENGVSLGSTGVGWGTNIVVGIRYDASNRTVTFVINDTDLTPVLTIPPGKFYCFYAAQNNRSSRSGHLFNFGHIPYRYQGNTGGFGNLDTRNGPESPIETPSDHFQTILDTGANILTTAQSTFPQGLWWIKDRVNTDNNQFVDSVRGQISGQWQAAPSPITNPGQIDYVAPAGDSVAWCWSAPEQFDLPAGTNGSDVASSGRRNRKAGFSIVEWTGTGASTNTVAHGLDKDPDFVIARPYLRSGNNNWMVYVRGSVTLEAALPATMNLNTNTGVQSTGAFQEDPTGGLLNLGDRLTADTPNIAYCWHKVPGYSDFGALIPNGKAQGTFVYTGFKPRMVMIKNMMGVSNWFIWDSKRNNYNPVDNNLYANLNSAEASTGTLHFRSSGFKFRSTGSGLNSASTEYLWFAFAEHPATGEEIAPPTAF